MRIAVDIPDLKYRRLKSMADSEHKTVQELMMRGIDVVLGEEKIPGQWRLKLPLIESDHPATLEIDNEGIYRIIDLP